MKNKIKKQLLEEFEEILKHLYISGIDEYGNIHKNGEGEIKSFLSQTIDKVAEVERREGRERIEEIKRDIESCLKDL